MCASLAAWIDSSACGTRTSSLWVPPQKRSHQRDNFSAEPRVSRWESLTQPPATMGLRWKPRLSHFPLSSKTYEKMQKSVRYNEGHALFLSVVARKEGSKRGYLSKKTAENSRWHEKFFALYQNVLFYFENEQSARPAGIYLLEGCTCERAPAPKMSTTGKEALEKQVRGLKWAGGFSPRNTPVN